MIETLPHQNHVVSNGNIASTNPNSAKKSKERERRRRRRKQKKSQAPDASAAAATANGDDSDAANDDCGDAKENVDSQQVVEQVVIDFVGIEDIHAYLAHLTEELDEAEGESAKISNEIELLNSTYMEDSSELESDLEWMKCSLALISAQQDREREREDEQMECFSRRENQSNVIYTHDEKQF